MAAKATPKADRPELEPVTYNLATLPMLNRTATELRNKIAAYVEYMTKGGKTPRQIHVFADQLATLRRAVNAQLSDAAPPLWGFDLERVAAGRRNAGEATCALTFA